MTNPVGKPPLYPEQPAVPEKPKETARERLIRMRANSKTLTPEKIKTMMEIQKKDKK